MKRYVKDYLFLFSIAGVIVFFDLWTKKLIRDNLPYGESWNPWDWLSPYARLVHWKNTGAAFGMGQDLGLIFAGLAFFVIAAIIYYFPKVDAHSWLIRLALAMQMGGALGNLIDRLLNDMHVTDFVSVWTFAVWNVADAAISVGTLLLLLGVWLDERKQEAAQTESEPLAAEAESGSEVQSFKPQNSDSLTSLVEGTPDE